MADKQKLPHKVKYHKSNKENCFSFFSFKSFNENVIIVFAIYFN